jgi:hypothetical protein
MNVVAPGSLLFVYSLLTATHLSVILLNAVVQGFLLLSCQGSCTVLLSVTLLIDTHISIVLLNAMVLGIFAVLLLQFMPLLSVVLLNVTHLSGICHMQWHHDFVDCIVPSCHSSKCCSAEGHGTSCFTVLWLKLPFCFAECHSADWRSYWCCSD